MVGGQEMRMCTSAAPASRTMRTILRGSAAHDGVVDEHDALAFEQVAHRIEFEA